MYSDYATMLSFNWRVFMARNAVMPGFEKTPEMLESDKVALLEGIRKAAELPADLRRLIGIMECLKPEEGEQLRALVRRATARVRGVASVVAQFLT